ncbi:MAG: LiaF domain-containing protein [Bacteroidota bacterium]
MNSETTIMENNERNGRIWTGVFLLIIGAAALARSYQVPMPRWLFTWQMLLIVIGVFNGLKNNFHGAAWFILIMVGGAFLLNDFYFAGELRRHIWPLILISIGAVFILRPRNRKQRWNWGQKLSSGGKIESIDNNENIADITVIFGSARKNMLTQNFAGGDITCIFGGAELDLTQADIQEKVVIDVTTIFGGADLIIPAHWAVKSEIVTILGSVQDERQLSPVLTEHPGKLIILEGTAILGGIKIKSFRK